MIFKREKEVARKLEFDGLYVSKQPPEEDIKGQWDRLVVNTPYVQLSSDVTIFQSSLCFEYGIFHIFLFQILSE